MAGRLVKTFEIFPNASLITTEEEKLKGAQQSYTRLHNNVRYQRIQRRQLNREMIAAQTFQTNNRLRWQLLQIAGGNTELAESLEACLGRNVCNVADNLADTISRISAMEDEQAKYKQQLFFIKKNLERLRAKANESTIYATDVWDHQMRNSELYVSGSLKVREFPDQGGNRYKFSIKTKPTRARVNNIDEGAFPVDEYGEEVFINIPAMYIDMTRYASGSIVIRFRAVDSADRVAGYVSRGQLHPHQTSMTVPCLGDFEGPVIEAITDFDIPTAVTIFELFLKQVDSQDGAGHYWFRWYDKDRNEESWAEPQQAAG
ncbi:MAG TPA: hypothetical protein DCW74_09040 [Alteromonas australica]|uniref:Uncharacterized protein n=1 Tax=Alteromonas australica TaxID=589873 RepID=A0A350P3J7_9ALTE|nr:hypothetical protein [Alteromonas australica]|tara:strand:- start:10847 stop:11797 length:951 start_codon:yes stop_codon:yes gene_type:complete